VRVLYFFFAGNHAVFTAKDTPPLGAGYPCSPFTRGPCPA
jgi:hypothetical protein